MADTCKFIIDESRGGCHLSRWQSGDFCHFHTIASSSGITESELYLLERFVKSLPTEHLNLSGLRFIGLHFGDLSYLAKMMMFFSGTTFKYCKFGNSIGLQFIEFVGCTLENCKFISTVFHEITYFTDCDFSGTQFLGVRFENTTGFSGSSFSDGPPPFVNCRFIGSSKSGTIFDSHISFNHSKFNNIDCPFEQCMFFAKQVSFRGAVFEAKLLPFCAREPVGEMIEADKIYLNGVEEVDFEGLSCTGRFEYSNALKYLSFVPIVHFDHVVFSHMQSANFICANLEKATFRNAILYSVNFINCNWPREGGRKIAYDEIRLRESENRNSPTPKEIALLHLEGDYSTTARSELVRLYTHLKRNCELNHDYVGAGGWYYREMEARRRAAKTSVKLNPISSRLYRAVSVAYKRISRYGESFGLPLIWLLIAYSGFSLLYLMNGFPVDSGHQLNYDFGSSGTFDWADIYRAFAFGFQAMTLRLKSYVDFQTWNAWPIFFFHFLSTATLVPLFLLALRRRFRR